MAKAKRKPKFDSTRPSMAQQADKHALYEKSVQAPEFEVEFFTDRFQELRGRDALVMKEDFCGTALLSVEWCKSDPRRRAIGVDLCPDTLAWGRQNNIQPAGSDVAERLTLVEANVLDVAEPKADITCAMNFSYNIFKSRDDLRRYFQAARQGLNSDGLFILDIFGGTECIDVNLDEREVDGEEFTYEWEHAKYNPITNEILCHIHFEFPDGSRLDKAFTYDWRLWSIQELHEILLEAGFSKVRVYWEEYEDDGDEDNEFMEGTGNYYETTEVENQESWLTYIVAEV